MILICIYASDARFAEKRIRKLELVYDEDGGDFIDSGGFSEVYKAVYKRKTVALKVFIKERRRNDEFGATLSYVN